MSETQKERVDRELIELLNELRVALPGVQVLFALLLTIPFSSRYDALTQTQRVIYSITFLSTLLAMALLTAPTAYHRLRFRQGDKDGLLAASNRFAVGGIAMLAFAITSASVLIADVMYDSPIFWLATLAVLCALVWWWFGLPLMRRRMDRS